jgi:hypothetical protein
MNIRNKFAWVMFKYEKLPNFCYHYGVVRHGRRGCTAKVLKGEGSNPGTTSYRPCLRVTPVFRKWRGGSGSWGRESPDLNSQPKLSDSEGVLMAAKTSSGGDGDSKNISPTPGWHDRRETKEECPGSSGSGVMKHDFREIVSQRNLNVLVMDEALQKKRKETSADPKGDEKGKKEFNGHDRKGVVALNDCQMEGTVMENDKLADLPSSDFIFKVKDKGQDLKKGHVGGPPTQYVGNWDSKVGHMKWQAVGDGLHEVRLDWDPKASSYFPSAVPQISKQVATRNLHNALSHTDKVEGSRSSSKFHKGVSRRPSGGRSYDSNRSRQQTWKKWTGSVLKEDFSVGNTDELGEAQVGKQKFTEANECGASNKERKYAGRSNPSEGISAKAVEQP